jgi:hypothetical protein
MANSSNRTPTHLASGDPGRKLTDFALNPTTAGGYAPVWLHNLADDVTLEGSMMNGAVGTAQRMEGPDPERRSYQTCASFADPDGNGWLVQEITGTAPWPDLGRLTT